MAAAGNFLCFLIRLVVNRCIIYFAGMNRSIGKTNLVFMDNLRVFVVWNVVFFHAIAMFAYPLVYQWPIVDKIRSSRIFECLILALDTYMMPHLIFIAAFFVFSSLKTKSPPEYLKKRFLRIFVPVIVYTICAGDVVFQIQSKIQTGSFPAYSATFLDYWRDFFHFGVITFIGQGKALNQVSFDMQHTWFLSVLFFFTLCTVVAALPFKKKEQAQRKTDGKKKIIATTVIYAFSLSLFYGLVTTIFAVNGIEFGSWIRFLGVVQVKINQFWMLLALFLFGLHMYRREWLTKGDIGSWKLWAILSGVLLTLFFMLALGNYLPGIEEFVRVVEHNLKSTDQLPLPESTDIAKVVYLLMHMLSMPICLFLLMFFISFCKRFFNKPNAITTFCSLHSINVHLLHYIPVILIQYMLMEMPLTPAVKILLMLAIVVPGCLWASHRFIVPHPLASVAFLAALKLVSLAAGFEFYYKALLTLFFILFGCGMFEWGKAVMAARTGKNVRPAFGKAENRR
jgi:hypothetical protein